MNKNIDLNNDAYDVSENDLIQEKLKDIMTPGYVAEFNPSEAEIMGAFLETAISEIDATNSSEDAIEIVEVEDK